MVSPMETLREFRRGDGAASLVAEGVHYLRTGIVNVCFVESDFSNEEPGSPPRWCLVDAGIAFHTASILKAANVLFGGRPPECILLTHGHFDHVGCLKELAEGWDVPIYAHRLEMPYLTGRSSYPPPDPTVGGGLMASLSWAYPKCPVNVEPRVQALPMDHSVPGLPEWRWVATPGHTPGHVSFFRETDRTLIAGDAFITVKQESLLAVLSQRLEMHGPPMYFTSDWDAARESVRVLSSLDPESAITGHGQPLYGEELREALSDLADRFDQIARPAQGRYAFEPALSGEDGVSYIPPDVPHPGAAFAVGIAGGLILAKLFHRRSAPAPRDSRDP